MVLLMSEKGNIAIGVAALAAVVIGAVYLFRDKIWPVGSDTRTGAELASGALVAAAETEIPGTGGVVTTGSAAKMLTPGLGILETLRVIGAGWKKVTTADIVPPGAPLPDDSVLNPSAPITPDVNLLVLAQNPENVAAAVAATYGPDTLGPLPSLEVRGESRTGVPLYRGSNQLLGLVSVRDAWGGSDLMELRNIGGKPYVCALGSEGSWCLGNPIGPCYYGGGTWDYNADNGRGRCIYA